jgi:nicotinamidase-related amidase
MTRAAFIAIDVQNYFLNKHTNHIPKLISEHLQANTYDLLIFTSFTNQPDSNFRRILDWNKCSSAPDTNISPELKSYFKQAQFINRCAYSAVTSEFEQKLHFNQVQQLFICGVDTDACVMATAFDLFDRGYNFKIIEELCASTEGEDLHRSALKIMQRNLEKQKTITA